MKLSFLITFTTPFILISQAHALQAPDPSLSYNDCMKWANEVDAKFSGAASERCSHLAKCTKEDSTGNEIYSECQDMVEKTFKEQVGRLAYPGKMPQDYVTEPVVTEEADSTLYDIKGGDAKGWENSRVGP